MPYVLLMIDETGEYPVVVDDNDSRLIQGNAQWRLISQVDSRSEGEQVAAAWLRAKASYAAANQAKALLLQADD